MSVVSPDRVPDLSLAAPVASLRICAVVVTFNRLGMLKQTVTRILGESVDHLLVVDNGSADGSRDWLAALSRADARLVVLTSETNLGGAGGFEMGLRHALGRLEADWFILMDDDARPDPGAVARFRALLASRLSTDPASWDGLAAAVRYPDGRICEMNRPWVNPFWHPGTFLRVLAGGGRGAFHLADRAFETQILTQNPTRIDGASFVGLFVSRRAVERTGLPDPRLFIYGDDVIYTLQMRRAGLDLVFHPAVRFTHDCSTFGADGRRVYHPFWKVYYNYRNGLLMYRAAAGPLFWALLPLVLPKWFALGRHYPPETRPLFRRLLRLAVHDALRGRLDRSHAEIVARSEAKSMDRA